MPGFFCSAYDFLASPQKKQKRGFSGAAPIIWGAAAPRNHEAPTADAEFRKKNPALGRCFGGDIQVMGLLQGASSKMAAFSVKILGN